MSALIREHYGCGNPSLFGANLFVAGLECEIEGVSNPGAIFPNFKPIPDHSLRNNGVEFITVQPTSRANLMTEFKHLHKELKFYPEIDPFSVRTSTHVHVNCLDLTLVEARTLILLYALFEECFFLMVKPVRRDNIHCVPLTETTMPSLYKKPLPVLEANWHKYTALNLKRLRDLGTMEFRHMHGTNDPKELDTWLSTLENLWNLSKRVEISAETLNKENIRLWYNTIFAPSDVVLSYRLSLFDLIRNSLIDVKFSIA
jgi:hypothetical protein